MQQFKSFLPLTGLFTVIILLSACTTNPATGRQQFAALMSPSQENQVGASEHQKIEQQYGFVTDKALSEYVQRVGASVTADTERSDVRYKFYIIDSPIVNAFALPGGYIYVSRGLLALANSEAELASVLGHEAGHITGRHSAERYSHSVIGTLGVGVLSAAIGSDGVSQALNLGSNLYLSSYSRDQENEADTLGLRYMTRAGYAPHAVPSFLYSLQRQTELEAALNGRAANQYNYFATHPATSDRVSKTRAESNAYPQDGADKREAYLSAIDGMVYGDSAKHGLIRGQSFYHPEIDFTFTVPDDFELTNSTAQVVASNKKGGVVIFDMAANEKALSPADYIRSSWLADAKLNTLERIDVNGMDAATASFSGQVSGKAAEIRVVAIKFKQGFARFQMAIPQNSSSSFVEDMKRLTYSFRPMSAAEKRDIKPYTLRLYKVKSGEDVKDIAAKMPFDREKEQRFRVLNAIPDGREVATGTRYKIIVEE